MTMLPHTPASHELESCSLSALLLHALTLDDDDPASGILVGAARDAELLAALAEGAQADAEYMTQLGPALESISRRITVALELQRRARATAAATVQATPAAPAEDP